MLIHKGLRVQQIYTQEYATVTDMRLAGSIIEVTYANGIKVTLHRENFLNSFCYT